MKKKRNVHYYDILIFRFCKTIVLVMACIAVILFREEFKTWIKSGGWYVNPSECLQSELKETDNCFLCGHSNRSLVDYYSKTGKIGIISLNDWTVLDFRLEKYDESGNNSLTKKGTSSFMGNTGDMSYEGSSTSSRGMASINIAMKENYAVDTALLQENLCEKCLDKIIISLEYDKFPEKSKKPIPLCLIDFNTLELYSLQEWHSEYITGEYSIKIEHDGDKVDVEVSSHL